MSVYYHGTTLDNKEKIIKQGFVIGKPQSYYAMGNGIYFTNIRDTAKEYGEVVITVELNDNKIIPFKDAGEMQKYIYNKTGNIEFNFLPECLFSDGKVGVKHKDTVVIFDTKQIKIIG